MLSLIEKERSVQEEEYRIPRGEGEGYSFSWSIRKEEKTLRKQFVQSLYEDLDGIITQWQTTRTFVLTQCTDARKIGHGRAEKRVGSVRNVTQWRNESN